MSIASISSAFVGLVGQSSSAPAAATPAPAAVDGAAATDRHAPRRGQRHELVDAMASALGLDDGERSRSTDQAVFRFAHALMHDLRAVAGPADDGPGRGLAWGRQGWSDLGQRLSTLSTAVAAGSAGSAGSATPPPATPPAGGAAEGPAAPAADATGAVAPVSSEPAASSATPPAAMPAATSPELAPPQPLTQVSTALWLSQVPSTRLLEAFANLSQALPSLAGSDAGGERGALSAFLDKLAAGITPTAVPEPASGSLFHATA